MPRTLLLVVGVILPACLPALPEVSAGGGQAEPGAGGQGTGVCGSGSWQRGVLEIHHIDAGEAMSTLIVSPTGRSLLIDAGEATWDSSAGATVVGSYVRSVLGCSALDYVLISHFHLDHVGYPGLGGLWQMVAQQGFTVGKLLHRDVLRYVGTSGGTFAAWREFLQSDAARALHPEIAVAGAGQIDLGVGVSFAIVAVDGGGSLLAGDFSADAAPPDENDYSMAVLLRMGRLDYFTAGDLSGETLESSGGYAYHDVETVLAPRIKDVDVYRVSHHGSSHASNATLLAELAPRVAILPVADGNPNGHPTQATVDRLVARSVLYLTEHGDSGTRLGGAKVVGHVVLRTADGIAYTVNGDAFTAHDPPRVDADGDGYFVEADPDDGSALAVPVLNGGCDDGYQLCR
jgi:beta-lactamase superfamily II metal-dependent hydrolase